jgi:ATP-binding cassette subfamily B protein
VRPVYIAVRKKIAEINSIVVEAVRGLAVIQVFGLEPRFEERVRNLGRERFRLEMKAQSYWYRIWMLVEMGEVIGIILVLGLGGAWALRGIVTIGSLFLFISYITRLFGPLRGLSDQINLIERAFASAERVFGILGMEPEKDARETDRLAGFQKELVFEGVNFSYQQDKWILNDIDFRIKKGERIALIGETGGGKTSIVSLLLKFYEPQEGRILIDGLDLTRIQRDTLRGKIGYVPQDVILFPGTVLENLRLFNREIPAERVHEAARRARIHDRIQALPKAYETDIIEQGVNLSFGERQLISFARALVFDPELVILDEATSSVDPESERLVQEGMKELLKDRTAIIIAHRLTTTRLADRIIVIHDGRLVEEGRHSDLIKRKGFYHRLYRLQYLSAIP